MVTNVYGRKVVTSFEELIKDNVVKTFSKDYEGYRYYSDNIVTLDSETQQIEKDGRNYSTPVSFQIAVNDKCMLMRTYKEVIDCIDFLLNHLTRSAEFEYTVDKKGRKRQKKVTEPGKLVIYIHNLIYDVTFMIDYMLPYMTNVFGVKAKISKFDYKDLIEFRDSLMLTGLSLDGSVKQYVDKTKKGNENLEKTKDWDYTGKCRSYKSSLTDEEQFYALADVVCLVEIIRGIMQLHKCTLAELPVSSTSFTRRECIKRTIGRGRKKFKREKDYIDFIHKIEIPSLSCYYLMKDCYYGGIADTNPLKADKINTNIGDYDITSEYPYAMATELFPMSTPQIIDATTVTLDTLTDIIKDNNLFKDPKTRNQSKYKYARGFMIRATVKGLLAKRENPLPNVIQVNMKNEFIDENNIIRSGSRVYKADKIEVSYNDIDFELFLQQYDFDSIEIIQCYMYKMDYLPKQLVKTILDFYAKKTTLKGETDVDKVVAYTLAKIHVNTIYGLMAQDPIMASYEMDMEIGELHKVSPDEDGKWEMLQKYNKNNKRFTYYLWGVYVASYGHQYLYQGIRMVKNNLIACDTDSVKFVYSDDEREKRYFKTMNDLIVEKLKTVATLRNIPYESYAPKTIKGVAKPLGVWDCDDVTEHGRLTYMISKRPKCYLKIFVNDEGEKHYKFTTAGIQSKYVISAVEKYMKEDMYYDGEKYVKGCPYTSIEDAFIKNVCIGPNESGKLTHIYEHNQPETDYIDDEGNEIHINNKHAVYLNSCSFSFNKKDIDEALLEIIRREDMPTTNLVG